MLLTLALAAGLAVTPPAPCPGPRVEELEAVAVPAHQFHFEGLMLKGFARLRTEPSSMPDGERLSFDRVTVMVAARTGMATVLFVRASCTVGALRTTPATLFQVLLSAIGPAI